jgi:hypothetical protein
MVAQSAGLRAGNKRAGQGPTDSHLVGSGGVAAGEESFVRRLDAVAKAGRTDGSGRRGALRLLSLLGVACVAVLAVGASSALAATPILKIDPVVTADYTTVEFSGEVDPKGDLVEWYDEISPDGGASWEFGDVLGSSEENAPQLITGAIHAGLAPGTTYRVRLSAFDYTTEELLVTEEPSPEFTTKSVAAPTATLDPITVKTDTTATLSGEVDPNSPGGLDEDGKNVYATSYEFHCDPECPGLSGGTVPAEASGGELEVTAHATGLEPNTEYSITLTAQSRGGKVTAGPQVFTTVAPPPTVAIGPGSSKSPGRYTLEGTVNPRNSAAVSCIFEWGPTSTYGHSAPCESLPAGGNEPSFVSADISGLVIGAEYHFRLVASNGVGSPVATQDATFVAHEPCPNEAIREEQGAGYLPECRAWELVSNPYKEGFGATIEAVSPDGNRVLYASNGNFLENGPGFPNFFGGNFYLATRGAGWVSESDSTKGPAFNPPSSGQIPIVSPDLSRSLLVTRRADQPVNELGLYRREPNTALVFLGPAADPSKLAPSLAGGSAGGAQPDAESTAVSADQTRVAFSLDGSLSWADPGISSQSPQQYRLYEYHDGEVVRPTLASVDNEGHPVNPGCTPEFGGAPTPSVGGGLRGDQDNAMSEDGRVLFWNSCGEIFARYADGTVVAVSASECDRGPGDPCLAEPLKAAYQGASSDGSVVYFTTTNQLVDTDTNTATDLYACAIPAGEPAPAGKFNSCETLTEVSAASEPAEVQGVIRVAGDGNRVYYVAHAALPSEARADGGTPVAGQDNVYLWERGESGSPQGVTKFVATLEPSDSQLWTFRRAFSRTTAQTTDSGRFLLLPVHAALITSGPQADNDGGAVDAYRYDAKSGELLRLSTDTSGSGGNRTEAGASVDVHSVRAPAIGPSKSHPAISEDGSVVFETDEPLSPFDHNETNDTYLWRDGRLSLVSSGSVKSVKGESHEPAIISARGDDVFFPTSIRLTVQDTDTQVDVYDARVDGGFAPVHPAQPCSGEACRPSNNPPASSEFATATATTSGAGNPPRPKSCTKGKIKRHGRCVKRVARRHRAGKSRHPAHKSRRGVDAVGGERKGDR